MVNLFFFFNSFSIKVRDKLFESTFIGIWSFGTTIQCSICWFNWRWGNQL